MELQLRVAAVAACIGLGALAGCGSTAQLGRDATGAGADQGLDRTGTGGVVQDGSTGTVAGPGGAGTPADGLGSAPGEGGSGTATGTTGRPAEPRGTVVLGPGVSASSITIGIPYFTGTEAAAEAAGSTGLQADPRTSFDIVIKDINSHGGVAGRKLVPLYFAMDANSAETTAQRAEAMCAFYTEDHKVFAVIDIDFATPCLNKAGVSVISDGFLSAIDMDPNYARNVSISAFTYDRMASAMLVSFAAKNWYSPWDARTGAPGEARAKVGVLAPDSPWANHAVDKILLPGLRAAGYPVDASDVVRVAPANSTEETGVAVSQIQGAVLKFRNDGVDHLVVMDISGGGTFYYGNAAYSQQYFPRLGGSSSNGFQALVSAGNIRPEIVRGMVGSGSSPVIDLPYDTSGKLNRYAQPTAAACVALLRSKGQQLGNANAAAVGTVVCDELYVLQRALSSARTLTQQGFLDAIDRLGTSYRPGATAGGYFGPGHRAAADIFYAMTFDQGCECVRYASGPLRLSAG